MSWPDHLIAPERYPGLVPRDEARRVLYMRYEPALGDCVAWALYQEPHTWWLRRVCWRKHSASILPSAGALFAAEVVLEQDVAEALLVRLSAIKLPPMPPDTPELEFRDGAERTITRTTRYASASLSWYWPPEGWEPLERWFEQARRTFDDALPAHSPR